MGNRESSSSSITSSDVILSTATGILYGVGVTLCIIYLVLMLLDQQTVSSITQILFGGGSSLSG